MKFYLVHDHILKYNNNSKDAFHQIEDLIAAVEGSFCIELWLLHSIVTLSQK